MNQELDEMEITMINLYAGGFAFLAEESDLYSRADLRKLYV